MVKLYSTHCPRCNVLEMKLTAKGIEYEVVTDTEEMIAKKFVTVPMLEVDDDVFDFNGAIKWVEEQ